MKNLPNGLSHDIVDLMPYPLLILDSELRVQIANRSFNQTFHVPLEGIEDRFIFGVGNGEWNIAALRMQLQKAFFEDTQIEDLEIQSDFPVIGHRNIMVSTTRIHSQDNVVPFILLTFNDVTKSKKAEDSTGFEKQLLDAAGQAIIATDLDGAIIYWNRFAETLYGWSTPDVMGRNIVDVNSADTWRQQDNEAISNLANDECLSSEYLERRQDGTTFPVFVAATPLRDTNGQQIGIVTVSKDITERKQAQEALRKSEQRFRALVENSADGIAINSADRSALFVSPSVTRLLGYSLEEYYGMKRNDLVHPDDRELVQREWDELLREPGKVVKTEQRVRHKDGSWRWIERISHNLLDDPSVKGIVGNFRDITEQKQAEEDLRESEGRFRSFFEQSLVGMAITAIDKGVILVNDKLCEMLGYSREEMLNLSWPDITHPDDLAADVAQFNRVIAGEIDGYSIDKRFIRKDGRTINVIMICRCLRDGATKVMHFVALVQDITERKQAEEKIKEQNRRLEILLKFSEQSIGQINMTSLLISLARSTLDILLAAEAVSVFLFDEHLGRLIFRGWASHGEGQVDSATVLYHTRLAELIYQSGNLQIVGDMSRQPMLVYWWQLQGSMLGLPLPVDGKSLGVLIATNTSKRYAFDDENSQWLQTLAVHAITAIQNVRLFEQVIAERERARQLGQQVIDAQEGERGRISRELHDEAGQSLTVLKINLHLIAADLPADFQHIRRQITDFEALIDKTMQHIRELIMNLRPLELDLTGLDAVLQNYCEHFANLTRIPVDYRGTTAILLGDTAKTYLYRFLQEALTNVLKHAQASRVWVRLSDEANKVSLSIEDDGRGFNPNLETGAEDKTPHFGLSMMQERLSLLGGRLELVSSPGQGTHLVAHLPGKETV